MSSVQVSNISRINLVEASSPPRKTFSNRGNFKPRKHIKFQDQLTAEADTPKKSKKSPRKPKMSDNMAENEDDRWSSIHEIEDHSMTSSIINNNNNNQQQQQPQKWKKLFRKHKVAILEMLRDTGEKQDGGRATLGLDAQQSVNGRLEKMYLEGSETKSRVPVESSLKRTSDSYIRSAIPYLPRPAAIACLVINILLPGVGTMVSGVFVFVCGEVRMMSKSSGKISTFCINMAVGSMQMMTVPFLFVGWMWSLVWGIYFILLSVEKEESVKMQEENNVKAKILSAFDPSFRVWSRN